MGGSVRRARGTVVAGPVPLLRPARAATREGELGAATARLAMGCIWLLADFMKVVKPEREPQPPIRIYNSTLSHKRGISCKVYKC